jgi:hypothetical protein
MEKIPHVPFDMDVPSIRRNLDNIANVRWLLRNLAIRNSEHPKFKEVMKDLKKRLTNA